MANPAGRGDSLKKRILALAWELLSAIAPVSGLVHVVLEVAGTRVDLSGEQAPAPPELKPTERALFAALSSRPKVARVLAREARVKWGSHVYAALRTLISRGMCRKVPAGFVRE